MPAMPKASAAEPAQQRGDAAESAGCWWKTHLVQSCRSLVALKNAAEDGRGPDQINRAIGRLNFLMRHASKHGLHASVSAILSGRNHGDQHSGALDGAEADRPPNLAALCSAAP